MIWRPYHKNILTFQDITSLGIAKMEKANVFLHESYNMALIKVKVLHQTANDSFVIVYTGTAHGLVWILK